MIRTINGADEMDRSLTWIKPGNSMAEALLLAGVLYEVNSSDGTKFGVNRGMPLHQPFTGHPAVSQIAVIPGGMEHKRLDTPVETQPGERLYNALYRLVTGRKGGRENIHVTIEPAVKAVTDNMPFDDGFVLMSSSSDTGMDLLNGDEWRRLAGLIAESTGKMAVQTGTTRDKRIDGTFDMRGKLKLKEVLALARDRCSSIVCLDSYLVQAAYWADRPAVVIRGNDDSARAGYGSQVNILAEKDPKSGIIRTVTADDVFAGFKSPKK